MAIEQRVYNIGFCKAAADLRTKQFFIVKVTATSTVGLTTAAGEAALGILQNKPNTNEVADVLAVGVSKVKIGVGGLTAGTQYEAATDGTAIAVTTAKVGLGTVIVGGAQNELAVVTVGVGCGGTIA